MHFFEGSRHEHRTWLLLLNTKKSTHTSILVCYVDHSFSAKFRKKLQKFVKNHFSKKKSAKKGACKKSNIFLKYSLNKMALSLWYCYCSNLFISIVVAKEPILLCSKVYILPIEYISSLSLSTSRSIIWIGSVPFWIFPLGLFGSSFMMSYMLLVADDCSGSVHVNYFFFLYLSQNSKIVE